MSITLRMAEEPKPEKRRAEKRRPERAPAKPPFLENSAPDPQSGEPSASWGKNHRVIVVDDDPVVLKAFELKLKAYGFNVTTHSTGAGVASTAEQTKAELIILDINFPTEGAMQWTGFTIMRWVHRFQELAGVPIIFMTATENPEVRKKALADGAAGFFEKPVDFKQLLAAMLKALGERSQVEDTVAATPNEPPTAAEPERKTT
jgi:CheY-like chemotaxis protein